MQAACPIIILLISVVVFDFVAVAEEAGEKAARESANECIWGWGKGGFLSPQKEPQDPLPRPLSI